MGNLDEVIEDRAVEPRQGFELLPAGRYKATVTASEVVPTSKGDGVLLKITETIWDEAHAGRELRTQFLIKHPSEKAQQIGRGKLSALAQACGLPPGIPARSEELHEKPHLINVGIAEGEGTNPATGEPYGPKNEIKGFYPIAKAAKPVTKKEKTLEEDELPDFLNA